MQGHGENLADNYSVAAPVNVIKGPVTYKGGRGMLVITAGTFPTTTKLQYLPRSGVAIDILTPIANGMYAFDAPAGQYQLLVNGGVVAGMYADLVSVRYG